MNFDDIEFGLLLLGFFCLCIPTRSYHEEQHHSSVGDDWVPRIPADQDIGLRQVVHENIENGHQAEATCRGDELPPWGPGASNT